jgi:hypothetical protein
MFKQEVKNNPSSIKYAPVTLQQIHDVGLNPFAVKLLAESYALHPNPRSVAFSFEGEKNGKPIKVFVKLDPMDPNESLESCRHRRTRDVGHGETWCIRCGALFIDGEWRLPG